MYIEFDTEYIADFLCKLAMREKDTKEIEEALYHLKAIAQNEYNEENFRTLLKVLKSISELDYLED